MHKYCLTCVKLNIGQTNMMKHILLNNLYLSYQVSENDLHFFVELIAIHGFFPEFLEIFEILIENCNDQSQNLEIQKKVLRVLLNQSTLTEVYVKI